MDFDGITNQAEFETTFNAVAALDNPVVNYPGATIQFGAPSGLAAIQSDIDGILTDVTIQKALMADFAMNSITAVVNSTPLPGLMPVISGTALTSVDSNSLFIDNFSLVLSAGSGTIAAAANSANHIEITGESTVASEGAFAPAIFLNSGGAGEVVLDEGSIVTGFDDSAGIQSGAGSATSVQVNNSFLLTTGDRSAIILGEATSSALLLEVRGQYPDTPAFATFGDNSSIVDFSGTGNSTAAIDIANVNDATLGPAIRSLGDNSSLFKMDAAANGSNSFSFSGVNSLFDASGTSSSIIDLNLGATSDALIYSLGSTFTTSGDNSDIVFINPGDSSITNLVTINSNMTTTGNGSGGIVFNGMPATSSLTLFNSNLQINTSGADAPGIFIEGMGDTSNLTASTHDSSVVTIGNASAGIFIGPLGNSSAMEDTVDTLTITTQGNNSAGYTSSNVGSNSAKSTSVADLNVTTQGNNSNAFEFGGVNGANSVTSFDMLRGALETNGDNSTGLLWRYLAGSNSVEVGSMDFIDVVTRGAGSAGIVIGQQDAASQHGGAITTNSRTVVMDHTTVRTEGADSAGVVIRGFGDNTSSSDVTFVFENFDIDTLGDRSTGLEVTAIGNSASNSTSVSAFDNIDINTSGDDAVGMILNTGAGATLGANSSFTTGIDHITIQTTGAGAHGLVFGSGLGTSDTLFIADNITATTSGANANALVISQNTVLADHGGNPNSTVPANFFDGFIATGMGGRSIQNNGTIEGGADGLVLTAGQGLIGNIANAGLITSTGPIAVRYDVAENTNDIFELQPGGTVIGTVEAGNGTDSFILGGEGTASFDYTLLDVQYNGFENVIKEDGSTWTLTGPDSASFNKPVTISGGTLVVNPVLSAMNVINETGGTLAGTGGIGSLNNFGTFSPGVSGAGQFSVSGDLTFNPGGTFDVDILANGTSDLVMVDVGGSVTLGGLISVNGVGYPAGFPLQQEYTVITSPNAIAGNFNSIADNLPDIDATVTVNQPTGPDDPDPNQPGTVVVGYDRGTEMSDKSLYPNSLSASANTGRLFANLLRTRGTDLAVGGTNVSLVSSEAGYTATSATSSKRSKVRANATRIGRNRQHKLASTSASYPLDRPVANIWVAGVGQFVDVESHDGISGFDARTGGIVGGVDKAFSRNTTGYRVGFAAGYLDSNIDNNISSTELSAFHLGGYGRVSDGPLQLSGAFGLGWQNYDFKRGISLNGGGAVYAIGDTSGWIYDLSLEVSYDLAERFGIDRGGNFHLSPVAQFDYVHLNRDGFTETNAGLLNLAVGGDRFSQASVSAGLNMNAVFKTVDGLIIRPELDLRWEHILDGVQPSTSSHLSILNGINFTTAGTELDRNYFKMKTGLTTDFSDSLSARIQYDGAFSQNTQTHQATATVKYKY